ncbi:hypothetical protein NQ317_011467 [Molorchus minor]|uniref:Fatty acyl-CoA reductase n=1 Tax=Molorchus minor TaxID=1323400 RepID=A0ABQ9J383_9CUCU|nr:hypothetical protein NQ317_011467 [Molorchus minor]
MEKFLVIISEGFDSDIGLGHLVRYPGPIQRFSKKVSLLLGDLEKPGLGLTEYDRNLVIKEVSCIFHCGGATKLDESLKTASLVNVRATRDLLEIAKEIKDLNWPTSNTFTKQIAEDYLEREGKNLPITIVRPSHSCFEGEVFCRQIIAPSSSNFTSICGFLAHCLTRRPAVVALLCFPSTLYNGLLPTSLGPLGCLWILLGPVRVIISACKEPIAGYVENIYSLAGLAAAYALGINRVNYFKDGTLDVIPVDYVVNLLIASGWYAGVQKIRKNRGDIIKTEVVVCNCISSQSRVLTTQEWFDFTETAIKDVPSAKMIQCPLSFNTSCYYNYKLITFLLHTLMGFLCDAGLKFCGKQSGIVQGYEKNAQTSRDR